MDVQYIGDVGIQTYDPMQPEHKAARKFLVWNDLILVGDYSQHKQLYATYVQQIPNPRSADTLIGAGDLHQQQIIGWQSLGFKLVTPQELRPQIIAALGVTRFV
ncbi:hypothetical protein GF380_06135 [Candidatus Uhrbacteria bacterium]|nr:hypothetical protein [Candidatus Uhrbacteria bacterium]MBD3284553.1 hypothetical protein [Candidatus Uhrbacteria bacterium]